MAAFQEVIDTTGARRSRRELMISLGLTTLAGSFGSVFLTIALGMPLILLLQAIGSSGVTIGAVGTVRLLATFAQIPGALACEHLDARKPFWARCVFASRLPWFLLPLLLLLLDRSWLLVAILVLVAVSEVLSNMSISPWLSWMAELIPQPLAGRFWGLRQTVGTLTALASLFLTGLILDAHREPVSGNAGLGGFALIFSIAAVLGVADIVVETFVIEPRPVRSPRGGLIHRRILAPFANRSFLFLTLCLGAWNFGSAMINTFGVVYLKRDFGISYTDLMAPGIAGLIGAMLTGYCAGHISDWIGPRRLLAILVCIAPFTMAAWFFVDHSVVHFGAFACPQVIVILCFSYLASGTISAAVMICQFQLSAELTPAKGRTMAMAVHWSFAGLLSALGPMVGGGLMDCFPSRMPALPTGLPFSFFHAQLILVTGILWFLALPLARAIKSDFEGSRKGMGWRGLGPASNSMAEPEE